MKIKRNRMVVFAVVVILLFLLFNATSAFCGDELSKCQKAYLKCLVSCIPTIGASAVIGVGCITFCTAGYIWCCEYYL